MPGSSSGGVFGWVGEVSFRCVFSLKKQAEGDKGWAKMRFSDVY